MTRRYSGIDYDQLDNFYYQVSTFIELGELLKVDLLLRYRRDLNGNIYILSVVRLFGKKKMNSGSQRYFST